MNSQQHDQKSQTKFEKIFSEPHVYENNKMFVVEDENPICNNHLLIFSTDCSGSLADAVSYDELNSLIADLTKKSDLDLANGLIYAERGRSDSCSSQLDCVGHSHILPKRFFIDSIAADLEKSINATKYSSFEKAFIAAQQSREEYLLFSDSLDNSAYLAFFSDSHPSQRQFLRCFLLRKLKGVAVDTLETHLRAYISEIWSRARHNAFAHREAYEYYCRLNKMGLRRQAIFAILGITFTVLVYVFSDEPIKSTAFLIFATIMMALSPFVSFIQVINGYEQLEHEHRFKLNSFQNLAQRAREARLLTKRVEDLVGLVEDLERDFQVLKSHGAEPTDKWFDEATRIMQKIQKSGAPQSFGERKAGDEVKNDANASEYKKNEPEIQKKSRLVRILNCISRVLSKIPDLLFGPVP